MLHNKKQQWNVRPLVKALQTVLRTTTWGEQFVASVAKPEAPKKIRCECCRSLSNGINRAKQSFALHT
ncbi:hypothetical protein M758_UG316700 [Ceratodon purpureus]|nr:hypothetical protein M758_UG316700 [Ceratodon purpureus]